MTDFPWPREVAEELLKLPPAEQEARVRAIVETMTDVLERMPNKPPELVSALAAQREHMAKVDAVQGA